MVRLIQRLAGRIHEAAVGTKQDMISSRNAFVQKNRPSWPEDRTLASVRMFGAVVAVAANPI